MPYDEKLAERVRKALKGKRNVGERKMFGGLCFMLRGNMCVAVEHDWLMVRVGPDAYDEALTRPHANLTDFRGRPMKGFVFVDPAGLKGRSLAAWVQRGADFAMSLPAK